MKQIANRFLVSFFYKLLPNLLAETLATTVKYFLEHFKIFHGVNFQRSRENFHGLLKIHKNCESFLTVKILAFTVYEMTRAMWQNLKVFFLVRSL